jgi:hypothetical protein
MKPQTHRTKIYLIFILLILSFSSFSQTVGVSQESFTPTSLLHVHNTSAGQLFQLSNVNTSGGNTPTVNSGFNIAIDASKNITFNQYENANMLFRINNVGAGLLNSGSALTFFGYQAGVSTTGVNNSAFGYQALYTNIKGASNVAIGKQALYSNTVSQLVAVGDSALYSNTAGVFNTALGYQSLQANSGGSDNTATGYWALYDNTTGNNNTSNGVSALYANTVGVNNTAVGWGAMILNTTASGNVAVGAGALWNQKYSGTGVAWGSYNTAIGDSALYNNNPTSTSTGVVNTAIGYKALNANTTGFYNTAVGGGAMMNATTALQNTACGVNSLYYNTAGYNNTAVGCYAALGISSSSTGYNNTAIGTQALFRYTTGFNNTAVGVNSLYFNSTGYDNVAVGREALDTNYTGNYNTALGTQALNWNTTGTGSTAVGYEALYTNSSHTGSYNTAIGSGTDVGGSGLTNATAIGNNAYVTASNSLVLGSINGTNNATSSTNVGIGITAPTSLLHVVDGGVSFAAGNMVTIDGNQTTTGNTLYIPSSSLSTGKLIAAEATSTTGISNSIYGSNASKDGYGIVGMHSSTTAPTTAPQAAGVYGETDAPSSIGVWAVAANTSATPSYAIWAQTNKPAGSYTNSIGIVSAGNGIPVPTSGDLQALPTYGAGGYFVGMTTGVYAANYGSYAGAGIDYLPGHNNTGIFGLAYSDVSADANMYNFGVQGHYQDAGTAYGRTSGGVIGTASGSAGTMKAWGALAYESATDGDWYAGYFSGNVYASGNVGIGTASPSAKLEIDGASSAWTTRVQAPNTAGTSYGLLVVAGTTAADYSIADYKADGATPYFLVYGNGNAWFAGTVTASCGTLSCSDIRYKKDITPLTNVLQNINKISGINYYWRKDEFPNKSFNNERQIGIIAQELEKIYPELVETDKDGYKSVDYSRLSPVLLEAIKEQQKMIDTFKLNVQSLKLENKNLQSAISNLQNENENLKAQLNAKIDSQQAEIEKIKQQLGVEAKK